MSQNTSRGIIRPAHLRSLSFRKCGPHYGSFSRHEKYGPPSSEIAWHYFTGQRFDDEIGLYFYNARYYNPVLGRFLTPDTIVQNPGGNPQTFNRYSYVGNNPVNYIDPTGHFFQFIAAIVSAVASAASAVVSTVAATVSAVASASAAIAHTAAAISAVTTIAGVATGNQDLLKVGRIAGYISIAASITNVGMNILSEAGKEGTVQLASNAASSTVSGNVTTLDTVLVVGTPIPGRTAGEILKAALKESLGAISSAMVGGTMAAIAAANTSSTLLKSSTVSGGFSLGLGVKIQAGSFQLNASLFEVGQKNSIAFQNMNKISEGLTTKVERNAGISAKFGQHEFGFRFGEERFILKNGKVINDLTLKKTSVFGYRQGPFGVTSNNSFGIEGTAGFLKGGVSFDMDKFFGSLK